MKKDDEKIDYSDIPEWTEADFASAKWAEPRAFKKKRITINLDREIIDYFKRSDAKGYQSRINAVLSKYVEARQHEDAR